MASSDEAVQITEEIALQRLDEAATQLQKEGRYLEALECMERGLVLRQRMFGVKSEEVSSAVIFWRCAQTPKARGPRAPCQRRASHSPLPALAGSFSSCAGLGGVPGRGGAVQPAFHVLPPEG